MQEHTSLTNGYLETQYDHIFTKLLVLTCQQLVKDDGKVLQYGLNNT